jgi:hypothetical protein
VKTSQFHQLLPPLIRDEKDHSAVFWYTFKGPMAIVGDPRDALVFYVSDSSNHIICKVSLSSPTQVSQTTIIAGRLRQSLAKTWDFNRNNTKNVFHSPQGLAISPRYPHTVFITDRRYNCVRRMTIRSLGDREGLKTLVYPGAPTDVCNIIQHTPDDPDSLYRISQPIGVTINRRGTALYYVDNQACCVCLVQSPFFTVDARISLLVGLLPARSDDPPDIRDAPIQRSLCHAKLFDRNLIRVVCAYL